MPRASFLSISLAAKCRMLFGLAVLLIITAALFVPWIRMRDLVHEGNIQRMRLLGRLAIERSELGSGNWDLKQAAVDRWWATSALRLSLTGPAPKLIPLPDPSSRNKPPPGVDEYTIDAIGRFRDDHGLSESPPRWRGLGGALIYRTILPIRATGGTFPAGTLLAVLDMEYVAPRAFGDLLINFGLSLMAGALAGIMAILAFYLIVHKLILSPVRDLTRVAESVSQGEHGVRSQIATGDEFEELSRAFNAMLSHLQASENELRRINKSLDTRLDELAERNVALFESNKLKSQFLSNVSHELRTPLASIIGFAELLREAASAEGGRQYRYAENIMSSGRMLLGLINDLLDLAKIEAGRLELHLSPVNLGELIQNLVDFMRPLADKKSLQMGATVEPDLPVITSDTGRIQQILYNLLSNAVKFTDDGGLIEIRCGRADDEHIFLKVRDTGVGIPESALSRVFEKFTQLDGSMTREHSGTGLGLAISRDLAVRLGGSISVASELGRGSVFTVLLPVNAPEDAQTSALDSFHLA